MASTTTDSARSGRTGSAVGFTQAQGSLREGAGHWKLQRLTALSNLPLVLWFVVSLAALSGSDAAEVRAWVGRPVNTILLVLLVVSTFTHARMGLQVVIEDYVHGKGGRVGALAALHLGTVALAASCLVAILKVSLGS